MHIYLFFISFLLFIKHIYHNSSILEHVYRAISATQTAVIIIKLKHWSQFNSDSDTVITLTGNITSHTYMHQPKAKKGINEQSIKHLEIYELFIPW